MNSLGAGGTGGEAASGGKMIRRKHNMADKDKKKREPLPGRMEALRSLPASVLRRLTKKEVRAFLFNDEWPDSMQEKLREYMVED